MKRFILGYMTPDSDRENQLLPPYDPFFTVNSKWYFICTMSLLDNTHHDIFTPVVEHCLE